MAFVPRTWLFSLCGHEIFVWAFEPCTCLFCLLKVCLWFILRICLAQGWVLFYCTMVRQPHEHPVVPWGRVPLRHCSSPYCFRFNNAPRWHTCCWQCGHWGSDYHTPACPVRQSNTVRTLVESQALLETILAQMDELPPVGSSGFWRHCGIDVHFELFDSGDTWWQTVTVTRLPLRPV